MKIRGKLLLFAAVALSALLLYAGVKNNPTEKQIKREALQDVSEALSVDVTDGIVLYTEDSHGGLQGDGLTFTQIQFDTKDCRKAIEESSEWKELPLLEDISLFLYGGALEEGTRAPLNSDITKEPCMQKKIENGYYYFLDRYALNYPNEANTPFLARYSHNFTLALFDTDTDILYYIKFDS